VAGRQLDYQATLGEKEIFTAQRGRGPGEVWMGGQTLILVAGFN
jgi:hypothetical protein